MNAGELDKYVTIQRTSQVTQADHSHIDTWSDLLSVWCQIKTSSTSEVNQGQDQQYDKVEIKFWATDITHSDRITHNSDIYDIEGVDKTRDDFYIVKATKNG